MPATADAPWPDELIDDDGVASPTHQCPARIFDGRVYKRGALVLHALRGKLGDEPFFTLLRNWAARHRHSTVTTQFVELAGQHSDSDLSAFFATWLHRPALPAI